MPVPAIFHLSVHLGRRRTPGRTMTSIGDQSDRDQIVWSGLVHERARLAGTMKLKMISGRDHSR